MSVVIVTVNAEYRYARHHILATIYRVWVRLRRDLRLYLN